VAVDTVERTGQHFTAIVEWMNNYYFLNGDSVAWSQQLKASFNKSRIGKTWLGLGLYAFCAIQNA